MRSAGRPLDRLYLGLCTRMISISTSNLIFIVLILTDWNSWGGDAGSRREPGVGGFPNQGTTIA
jgi:hypothetical protein